MVGPMIGGGWLEVEAFVEDFEAARSRGEGSDLAAFLPPPPHPLRLKVLAELVRVDMEYGWRLGEPHDLGRYRREFPELFEDGDWAAEIAFEEARLRRQAGVPPESSRNAAIAGIDDAAVGPEASRDGSPPGDDLLRAATAYRAFRRARSAEGPGGADFSLDDPGLLREHVDLFRDLHGSDPDSADRLARAVTDLPSAGSEFLGFRLRSELGRGTFGRVYLAHQGDLADRPVALKVSADVSGESHVLAQLRHTNVVPIYSVHRGGPFQAVCMPFLGSTTLADVLAEIKQGGALPDSGLGLLSTHGGPPDRSSARPAADGLGEVSPRSPDDAPAVSGPDSQVAASLVERFRGFTYVGAILWLASRLADGLAHAHERGILHRDLKPANILFGDDGEPLLLDFNLADDTKLRVHASAALVGGTLPYMAPEQLDAFRGGGGRVDARSDLYSIGVILFELLTGRRPFEIGRGRVDEVLPRAIEDRIGPPPRLRPWNKAVSPAVESIVRRCLELDPARRYQSARQLQEDLSRQLENRPLAHAPDPSTRERLGKWARRHPRLTSATSVAAFCAAILVATASAFLVRQRGFDGLKAASSLSRLEGELRQAEILLSGPESPADLRAEGVVLCRSALDRYALLRSSDWDSRPLAAALGPEDGRRLHDVLGALLILLARSAEWRAEAAPNAPQRADRIREALELNDRAAACYGPGQEPGGLWLQRSALARMVGRANEADELLTRAMTTPLRTTRDQLMLVDEQVDRGEFGRALAVYSAACEEEPRDHALWFLLGNCQASLGHHEEAMRAFEVSIALRPDLILPTFRRGMLALDRGDYRLALKDFDRVLTRRPRPDAYANRALARLGLGDPAGAVADLDIALCDPAAPTRVYFIRSIAHQALGDRKRATDDREEGLRREPADDLSWVARGMARLSSEPDAALRDFEAALRENPRCLPALQNRAAVLADLPGKQEESIRTFDRLLASHPGSLAARTGRGIVLARLGRRDSALRDAAAALGLDRGADTLYRASNIYAQVSKIEPADRRVALALLSEAVRKDAAWLRVIPNDSDLDPIRQDAEFRPMIDALETAYRASGVDSFK